MASKHLDSRANLQAGKRDWQTGRQAGRQEREHNYRASEPPLVACPPPKSLPPPWIHRLVHPSSTLLLRTTPTLSPVLSAASFVRTVVRRPLRSPLLGALVIQSCSESVYQYIFGSLVSVLFFFFFPSTNRVSVWFPLPLLVQKDISCVFWKQSVAACNPLPATH